MGIQKITERQEVQKGAVSYQTGFRVPDLSSAAASGPATLGKALAGIGDGVRDISVALAKIDETDADSAVREIRKFSDHVLNVGYRDPSTGVQEPGIAVDERIESIRGSAVRHDALVNDFSRKLLKGANETVRRLVSDKTDEMRSRTTHALRKREVLAEANFQYKNLNEDVQERISSLVDSQLMASRSMRNGPLAEYVVGNAAAAMANGDASDESTVERMKAQATSAGEAFARDYGEGFDALKNEYESIRSGMARRLEIFCLHGRNDAENKADLASRKMVTDVISALVKDGDFGRARAYASRLKELGFTEEQKSDQIGSIEKAEKAEVSRVDAEMSATRQKRREELYKEYYRGVNEMYRNGGYNPKTVVLLKRQLADEIEGEFSREAASERAQADKIERDLMDQEKAKARDDGIIWTLKAFDAETMKLIDEGRLSEAEDPKRYLDLADRLEPIDPRTAEQYRSRGATISLERAKEGGRAKEAAERQGKILGILNEFYDETDRFVGNGDLAGANDPKRIQKLAKSLEKVDPELAARFRKQGTVSGVNQLREELRKQARTLTHDAQEEIERRRKEAWKQMDARVKAARAAYIVSCDPHNPKPMNVQRALREEYDNSVSVASGTGAMDPDRQVSMVRDREMLDNDAVMRGMAEFYSSFRLNGIPLTVEALDAAYKEGASPSGRRGSKPKYPVVANEDAGGELPIDKVHEIGSWLASELTRINKDIYAPEMVDAIKKAKIQMAKISVDESRKQILDIVTGVRRQLEVQWRRDAFDSVGRVMTGVLGQRRQNASEDRYGTSDDASDRGDRTEQRKSLGDNESKGGSSGGQNPSSSTSDRSTTERKADDSEWLGELERPNPGKTQNSEVVGSNSGDSDNRAVDENGEYTVKDGDDIVSIAIAFDVSPSELVDANGINPSDRSLKPGRKIKIPGGGTK